MKRVISNPERILLHMFHTKNYHEIKVRGFGKDLGWQAVMLGLKSDDVWRIS